MRGASNTRGCFGFIKDKLCCGCMGRNNNRPIINDHDVANNMIKKRCLFFSIICLLIFSILMTGGAISYLMTTEIEWVEAVCKVTDIIWYDDLYSSYVFMIKNQELTPDEQKEESIVEELFESITNETVFNALRSPSSEITFGKNNSIGNDSMVLNSKIKPIVIQVRGWLYLVNVKYKNMYFRSTIKDPSETQMIPPLYSKGYIGECLCMIEKLKSEMSLQKEDYEKYKEFIKKNPEENDSNNNNNNNYFGNFNGLYGDDDEDSIFFVTSTTWKDIDEFTGYHKNENYIKIFLITIPLLNVFFCAWLLRIFYKQYSNANSPVGLNSYMNV